MVSQQQPVSEPKWVKESRFGKWFLSTEIWFRFVLTVAIAQLNSLLKDRRPVGGRILDAGCGQGQAFVLLEANYKPKLIVGVDIDSELIDVAARAAEQRGCSVNLAVETINQLPYGDGYFDTIFCHQLLHHVSNQTEVLHEFYRLLSPGGQLLICESCHSFIDTFLVQLFFKHPMQAQKTAEEYVELIRSVGFHLDNQDIKTSSPWWSQRDFGLMHKWGLKKSNSLVATEVVMVIRKC